MDKSKKLAARLEAEIELSSIIDDRMDRKSSQLNHPVQRLLRDVFDPEDAESTGRIEALLRLPAAADAIQHISRETRDFLIGFLEGEEEFSSIFNAVKAILEKADR